ncbi:hypothetical protein BC826DRAFT_968171 [Russula brevipes]|nr:hypothetical protein BC826DRAFT_968171 [Russula brevipes]
MSSQLPTLPSAKALMAHVDDSRHLQYSTWIFPKFLPYMRNMLIYETARADGYQNHDDPAIDRRTGPDGDGMLLPATHRKAADSFQVLYQSGHWHVHARLPTEARDCGRDDLLLARDGLFLRDTDVRPDEGDSSGTAVHAPVLWPPVPGGPSTMIKGPNESPDTLPFAKPLSVSPFQRGQTHDIQTRGERVSTVPYGRILTASSGYGDAHHRGTAEWFTNSTFFKDWKASGCFMWIHGKHSGHSHNASRTCSRFQEKYRSTLLLTPSMNVLPPRGSSPHVKRCLDLAVTALAELHISSLRLCVTSRPEIDIQTSLERLTSTSNRISLHDQNGQRKDIVDYVSSVFCEDIRMKKWRENDKRLAIETLSERADGMFRWVFCQLEVLRHCLLASVRSILAELPQSLDETYERILLEISLTRASRISELGAD